MTGLRDIETEYAWSRARAWDRRDQEHRRREHRRQRRLRVAELTAAGLALAGLVAMLMVMFPQVAVPAGKRPVLACWSGTERPVFSWESCANRQRANHKAAAKTIRQLRAKPTRSLQGYTVPYPWNAVASCESGGRWDYNGSSGFDGGLQFHPGTWTAYRLPSYPAYAYQASAYQQVQVAERVLAAQGWGAWPVCSRKLGLR